MSHKKKREKKRNRFAAAITNVLIKSRKKIYFEFGSYLICFVAGVTLWYGGGGEIIIHRERVRQRERVRGSE